MFYIDRTTWIIIGLVGALLASTWWVFNRPDELPAWPETINGVSFSPFRAGQSPQATDFPTREQISSDLELLADRVESVRTYSVESTLGLIPELAAEHGLQVKVGVWISGDIKRNWQEIQRLQDILSQNTGNITGIVVGNEVLLRQELTAEELARYVAVVRSISGSIPVTVAETWDIWLANKTLASEVDFITAHVLPYWEGIPIWQSPDYVFRRYEELQREFAGYDVVLGEVGWPSEGRQRFGAVPSMQNQAAFLRQFLEKAAQADAEYFVLEAFDQVWKIDEGEVGRYWGIYNAQREAKFPFTDPVTPVPRWQLLVGMSLIMAILLLALLLRDSQGLLHKGRGFLVLVSYAISTTAVWLVYDYTQKYMTWQEVLVGIGLLSAALCISVIVLTEAHEWAESVWNHRTLKDRRALPELPSDHRQLKVSVHVPTYNEPPDVVIESLQALKNLDYENYEVIVVDNNTDEESTWLPVKTWCEQQDGRFRFFHVKPLEGFKAGALNFALAKTADDAELIAVIDCDYTVAPDWLRVGTRAFEHSNVGIVQAPQDYRDAEQSLFKSMIYAEYAGFFGIGMVNRDTRNAIIQHGTMTIVRRTAIEKINGWSEWCITEDAELGLRILEAGYRATYIPQSMGRGLMPDNFLDYKKQRFRWAYGSVLILRHHLRYFLSLKQSRLTAGQRYHFLAGWLPWMADGLCLIFNLVALWYAVLMVLFPGTYNPPEVMLSLLPISYFIFKAVKMLVLYRSRMRATLAQSLGAGLAGLAVSHTVARAMLSGLHNSSIGFFRTPKDGEKHSIMRALADVREEALIATALITAAIAIGFRYDSYLLDTQLWMLLLVVQSTPYLAAVLLSIVSAREHLPVSLFEGKAQEQLLGKLPETLVRSPR